MVGHLIALYLAFGTVEIVIIQAIEEVFFGYHGFPDFVPIHDVRLFDVNVFLCVSEEKENKLQDLVITQDSVVLQK